MTPRTRKVTVTRARIGAIKTKTSWTKIAIEITRVVEVIAIAVAAKIDRARIRANDVAVAAENAAEVAVPKIRVGSRAVLETRAANLAVPGTAARDRAAPEAVIVLGTLEARTLAARLRRSRRKPERK